MIFPYSYICAYLWGVKWLQALPALIFKGRLLLRCAYLWVYTVSRIRKCLTKDSCISIFHAFITSRLDYCNTLLVGLPDCAWPAARVVTFTRKFSHITPVLCDLHWLPVTERISFKVLLLMYKALHGKAPKYISDMLSFRDSRKVG